MGSLKKNSRKGKKSKKYKKYRRQKGGDAYSLDRNIKEINECIWRKKMEKQQRDEEAYRQELLRESTSEHRKEVKEYLYLLPEVDDSDAVVKTFDTMGRIINNDALEEYLIYFDIKPVTPEDFEELKQYIISEITLKSGKIPEGYGNFISKIDSLTYDGGKDMIEDKFGKKGTKATKGTKKPKTLPTLLYLNPLENIEKIKYVEKLKLFFNDNESQYQNFKESFELCSDETSKPDSMLCQIRDGGLPKMVSEDSDLEALLHSMYVSAHEVEESYRLYANETEKKYNFHKIIKEMVVFIIENVYNFEELKAYAKFFIDEKEMFKLFFKCRIESSKYNILHVSYAYLTKQTHKKLAEIEGNESLEDFLKEVNQKNFEKLPEKVLEYWDTQCSSGTKTRSKTKRALNELKSIHDSMLGCSILNKKKPTLGGGRKKTKKKNKLKGGADTISNNAIQEILVDIAKNAFQEDKEDFLHDSSHDNLITRSYGKEDENTLEAKCSDGVTVSEKIKSFGKFFLINDKGLPDETVFPNPCGDSFNNTLSFVIDAGSFKQFRPYHKNKCENEKNYPNFKTTKNISNYVDPAATGKGDLYRCYTVLFQSGNTVTEQAIDGANRFVKLCVAFTRALIIDGEQKLDHHDLKPSPDHYKYIFEYLEGIRIIDIYKSDLVCLYKNNKERFVWEGNQSPMASFINSAYDENNTKKIADPRSKNNTSLFLKAFFEKVDKDNKADKKKEIKIGMCRILKYMGDKSHIIACIILILITEKPYIVQTIDRLLSKAIIQVIEYCKSNKDNNYESISKNLGVMISGGELNKPPKYAQGLPAYSNIFNNNNLDFVTNPYNILFLYFTGDPITAKEGIITEICKNLAEFSQVFTQIENDPQREPYRTIYYVTSMCLDQAKIKTGKEENNYEEADKESLIKGQLEEELVTKDNSPTEPISIINSITPKRDDELELIELGVELLKDADKEKKVESVKEDKLDEFIEALTNEDLFKFMSLYKKVESVKKNKDDFDRLYKKYVENRPGGLNYLLKVKTTMRAPRVSTVKYRVEQEGGNVHIWNDKKKEGLFPPFTVVNPEIRFSEYYKLLSLSFEEPKYGTPDQRLEIKTHCQQLVDYITALEDSLKNGEDYPYDDTLYGVIKLSLGYEDPTPESDGGSLANHRYAITKRFEEGTLTGFVNRAQGFITSITKIVELSRNIVNEKSTGQSSQA